jgi:hypothetical protein
MKHLSRYLIGCYLGLSLVLSAIPGHAQDSNRVKVTIPFDFVAGTKQLKAGDYVVESLLDGQALRFSSNRGVVQQIVFALPIEAKQAGHHERLLFRHDGDKYVLSQVWLLGDNDGRELSGVQQKSPGRSRPVSDQAIVGQ